MIVLPMQFTHDVVIVGGGPAGLSAALVLARANRHVVVIDAAEPRNRAARSLHNYLGMEGCAPHELLHAGRENVGRFGVALLTDRVESVLPLECEVGTAFEIKTSAGRTLRSRKLVFATGLRDELPTWPGVGECYGVSVHHCPYCDGYEYRDRLIAVTASEPDQALGLAKSLRTWSRQILVLTDGIFADGELLAKCAQLGFEVHQSPIIRLVHDGGRLSAVELSEGKFVPAV